MHTVLLEVGDYSEFENEMDVSLDDPRDILSDAPLDDGERRQVRKQHLARQRSQESVGSNSGLKRHPSKTSLKRQRSRQVG